ncbi:MAG: glycerophosphodiester phosphodiesterase family protein [Gemmatimonadota bacterium]|nr:glycerophosphodiester phosphodiesterase family protein [Gemmatimonadota bacterium]
MIAPLRIAHRGASGPGLAPENTLVACEKALQIGVDMLEIDVHATRDGQIVVLHDAALDRTTNGTGLVADLLGEEVRQFDAGRWFSADFADERVPLLEEVLDLARNQAVVLIEIKADGIAERVLQVIEAANAVERVVVQAFNPQTVRRLNLLAPTLPTALLVGQLPTTPSRVRARRLVRQVLQVGANALAMWYAALTPPFLEEMRQRGIAVWAWTVDEDIAMRDLATMGVQGIITNRPDQLNQVLDELVADGSLRPPLGRRIKRSRWGRRRQLRKLQAAKRGR